MNIPRNLAWLVCVAAVFPPATLYAEKDGTWSNRIVIGGHLGIDFATIGGTECNDVSIDCSYTMGIVAGAAFTVHLTRIVSARTELGYVAKGGRGNTDFPSSSATLSIDYLELPFLLHASVPVAEKIEPYGYVGPALGILLDADIEYDDGRSYERNSRYEPFDVGLMFGAGATVEVNDHDAVTFDVRYNLGLRDRVKPSSEETSLNRAIYFTVGYQTDLSIFSGDR